MDFVEPRADLAPLRLWERRALFAFLATFAVYAVMLEIRCVFMPTRQTDLGVYLRGAWAARVGENPYTVEEENGWHYCYPPIVSLSLIPLADAPEGAARTLMVPWPVSVILWYLLSVACLFLAVHWIAKTLEDRARDPAVRNMPAGCRRWWFDRVVPILLCLVQIGGTFSRGQITFMVILCVAGIFASLMNGHRLRSGLWLAAAICLKIIPAFLLLFPLWRRDGRALAGATLGLGAGFLVIPSLYWGVPQAWELNRQMVDSVLHPGLRLGGDQTRAEELTNITATDNQSFLAILHNYQYWGRLETRPGQPAAWARTAHWLIGGILTLALLGAAGRRPDDDPIRCLAFLGSLFLLMALVSPVSHLHYFSMALPLVMALLTASLEGREAALRPRPALWALLVSAGIGYALPSIPVWEGRREAGLPMIVSVVLLGVSMHYLWAHRRRERTQDQPSELPAVRAA